jgi:hypothetical protein
MPSFDAIFDANAVPPSEPFEVLPAGKYRAQVIASEMRTTKDGTSMYLWLEFEIREFHPTNAELNSPPLQW